MKKSKVWPGERIAPSVPEPCQYPGCQADARVTIVDGRRFCAPHAVEVVRRLTTSWGT